MAKRWFYKGCGCHKKQNSAKGDIVLVETNDLIPTDEQYDDEEDYTT